MTEIGSRIGGVDAGTGLGILYPVLAIRIPVAGLRGQVVIRTHVELLTVPEGTGSVLTQGHKTGIDIDITGPTMAAFNATVASGELGIND